MYSQPPTYFIRTSAPGIRNSCVPAEIPTPKRWRLPAGPSGETWESPPRSATTVGSDAMWCLMMANHNMFRPRKKGTMHDTLVHEDTSAVLSWDVRKWPVNHQLINQSSSNHQPLPTTSTVGSWRISSLWIRSHRLQGPCIPSVLWAALAVRRLWGLKPGSQAKIPTKEWKMLCLIHIHRKNR